MAKHSGVIETEDESREARLLRALDGREVNGKHGQRFLSLVPDSNVHPIFRRALSPFDPGSAA